MSTVFVDAAKVVFLGVFFDDAAYGFEALSWSDSLNANVQALSCGIHQSFCQYARFSHKKHAAGIAMIAILDDGDIDVDNIAFF